MVLFYRWGSTALKLEPLRRGSLLFITKFPKISGTHFIYLKRMKGSVIIFQRAIMTATCKAFDCKNIRELSFHRIPAANAQNK